MAVTGTRTWILVAILFMTGGAARGAGWEAWLVTGLSQRFDYGLEARVEVENRLAAEGDLWRRVEITPELIWHYSPRYDFSIGYEDSRSWQGDDETVSREGLFSGTIRLPLKEWLVTSRQRFQFGDEEGKTTGEFRQRTQVSYEGTRFPFRLKPFISDEWFLDLTRGGGINENRLQVGVAYDVNPRCRIELYGMRMDEWSGTGKLQTTPVTGINMNWNF